MSFVRLGVNIDHVATVREVRGIDYPDPAKAAMMAIEAGADGITLHLREDRRHIKEYDLARLKSQRIAPINLEMAATSEMLKIAKKYQPGHCCLVPEKREELTTEGGLDVVTHFKKIKIATDFLQKNNIVVSLFICPEPKQIKAACLVGVRVIEIHTGNYANAKSLVQMKNALKNIQQAARLAKEKGLTVNAGHGLTIDNVGAIAEIPEINELNIGHSLIADAIFEGIPAVVKRMRETITKASLQASKI